jgi:dTDP-glucose 4,6-dehydratase
MKRVLISGISGFVGSHVLAYILKNTDWEVVGIASWKHKGTPERIEEDDTYQEQKHRVTIITHDLESPFTELTKKRIGHIDYMLNLASDSHVDRSITDPVPFIQNNVNLILTMLELAREIKPEIFLQFSTDEVYGAAPMGVNYLEWSSILPSNPYSASKAAQEAIAISYWRTYDVPVIITNGMNIFGERQDKEKYLAMCISMISKGQTLPIHGNEKHIGSRFYIHARNVANALLYILNNLPSKLYIEEEVDRPDRYNIVGEKEINNLEMAQMIADILGKPLKYELVDFHAARKGHDRRYALSGEKLKKAGWTPAINLHDSLKKYVNWAISHSDW